MTTLKCARCGSGYQVQGTEYGEDSAICPECRHFYPPSLLKAEQDQFDYALRLSTGEIIRFESASFHGDYVRLHASLPNGDECFTDKNPELPFRFARGIDVRLSEIVWCADAPQGS